MLYAPGPGILRLEFMDVSGLRDKIVDFMPSRPTISKKLYVPGPGTNFFALLPIILISVANLRLVWNNLILVARSDPVEGSFLAGFRLVLARSGKSAERLA